MDNNFSDNRNSFLEMTFLNSINWISVIHKIIEIKVFFNNWRLFHGR